MVEIKNEIGKFEKPFKKKWWRWYEYHNSCKSHIFAMPFMTINDNRLNIYPKIFKFAFADVTAAHIEVIIYFA